MPEKTFASTVYNCVVIVFARWTTSFLLVFPLSVRSVDVFFSVFPSSPSFLSSPDGPLVRPGPQRRCGSLLVSSMVYAMAVARLGEPVIDSMVFCRARDGKHV